MIFDGTQPFDRERAAERLQWLLNKEKTFELKVINGRRSIRQNSYLHLILQWFALEYGETTEYVKQYFFKKVVNRELFQTEHINEKTGEIREDWKSTAVLTKNELTTAIDRFRVWSSREAGIYLPDPSDLASINSMELQIKKSNKTFI